MHSIDANHHEIINALRASGENVEDLSAARKEGFPDILCAKHNRVILIEIKSTPDSGVRRGQLAFAARFRGFVGFACSPEEALDLCRAPEIYALKQAEKDKIAGFLERWKGEKYPLDKLRREVLGRI